MLNTKEILLTNNTFTGNVAQINKEVQFKRDLGEGGAIYYGCDPDSDFDYLCNAILQSNTFIANQAERKGGSLRYINKNFTFISESFSYQPSHPEKFRLLQERSG